MVIFVLLLNLGLGQIISAMMGWRAMSLVGPGRWMGYGLGWVLLLLGGVGMVSGGASLGGVGWVLLTTPLTLLLLLLGGAVIKPPPHPDGLFAARHPAHGGCRRFTISAGEDQIPALLLRPSTGSETEAAVCILHGSGDNKQNFKWRLVHSLLEQGLTVLTIDLPGHGEYLERPLAYPECLTSVSTSIRFLRDQANITQIGLLGISLGGAMALKTLADDATLQVEALAVLETPLQVSLTRRLIWREMWQTLNAPVLSLLREMSARQVWQSWQQGAIRSRHSTAELFQLLNPLESISRLPTNLPILLVYSRHDPIAPLSFGERLQQAAPHATLIPLKKAGHVTLTLIPVVNNQVAGWLRQQLRDEN